MSSKEKPHLSNNKAQTRSLRLWPGVIIVAFQWLAWLIVPIVVPEDIAMRIGVFGGFLGGLLIIIWWLFLSRADRIERYGAIALMILAPFLARYLLHESIATSMMGLMFLDFYVPVMSLAFVSWVIFSRNFSTKLRRITLVIIVLLASGIWILLRTDGMDGSGRQDFAWRWAETHEEKLLEKSDGEFFTFPENLDLEASEVAWPGFRGPRRDGTVRNIKIKTDWSVSPPIELWRRPIGPGCSSCAVFGELLITQEQRGEFEVVSCYNLTTGLPVWMHQDSVRFYDSHAGAGPRSTPTVAGKRIYTLGATGILNVLDVLHGSVIWSRNAATDAGVEVLTWGFTSSPLVVGDVVIVALSGKLAAYDIETGDPRWFGNDGGPSYSSPHLFTIKGVPQVLLMSKSGANSVDPKNGKELWNYSWPNEDRILQPAIMNNGDLIFSADYKSLHRVSVTQEQNAWILKKLWSTEDVKFDFNDFVIHKDHAFGFDGPSLVCISLADGKRKWKGNRYRGWILLLADQELLLILSERGELVLVEASPDHFSERSKIRAINGKTWNHPAMAGDIVIVRNALEMAAFRLPL